MKYRLTDNLIRLSGWAKTTIALYQIEALKDFGNVKAGDLGGFVESLENLDQAGDCWISDQAKVWGNAKILENAIVSGQATVCENAQVSGEAIIGDYTVIEGSTKIQ